MRCVWMNTVAAAALAAGIATAGAQTGEKEPPGTGQGQIQNQAPSEQQQKQVAPRERGGAATEQRAPRQVGPGSAEQAPRQQQDRGTARTQERGPEGGPADRSVTKKDMQDRQPRAREEGTRTQDRVSTPEERRGQIRDRAGAREQGRPQTTRRQDDTSSRIGGQARTQERIDRSETRGRTSDDIRLTSRDKTTIRQRFESERNLNVVSNVNFSVSIGASVPRSVRLAPVPASIVAVAPQFRGYRYVVIEEEIVIVHPRTLRVVAVLPHEGRAQARVGSGTQVRLSGSQRARILSLARDDCDVVLAELDFRIAEGVQIPQQIELCPFEEEVVAEVDVVRPYRYFVVRDEVVLVDPSDYRIIEVIR